VWALAGLAVVLAQTPELSGTWRLDRARSEIDASAGLAGLGASGSPEYLHITHAANGTLIVESQLNESHARIYRPGARTSTPAGQGGSIILTSNWDGRTLVGVGRRESGSGGDPAEVSETLTMSADGRTLTIQVRVFGPGDTNASSTLVYVRTLTVEPCQKWPTPCK
jgi:hypothetical protein